MIRLDKDVVLTEQVILKLIKQHKGVVLPRLEKLKRYYLAKDDINMRENPDPSKPNNKIANNYAGYITDTLVGYFVGEPITYNSQDTNVLEQLNELFEYNDEADENTELAKAASIYGVAFERLYFDEDGQLRFKALPTEECIPVYDTTIEANLLYLIRYTKDYDIVTDTRFYSIEVIDSEKIVTYKSDELITSLRDMEVEEHYFKMVPVAIYRNNDEETGDFEKVISLIDAYDKMESDSLNDYEYFVDAYLALYGYTAESEDIAKMKQDRVILMDEGTRAEWLIKDAPDTSTENLKIRIDNDIHKFSFCPNMTDKEFAANASGVAIKFKLMGTENLVSIKERKFKRGLQQRLEIISRVDQMLGNGFDWRDIDIIFSRNLPANDLDAANIANLLSGIVSDETLMAQISFVDDIQAEKERIKQQKAESEQNNYFAQSLMYRTKAMEDQDNNSKEN